MRREPGCDASVVPGVVRLVSRHRRVGSLRHAEGVEERRAVIRFIVEWKKYATTMVVVANPLYWRIKHVHLVGTTGMHEKERRSFNLDARCRQCGVSVDRATAVAAHVVSYPCGCWNPGCVGFISLQTTCRRCNARHRVTDGRGWWCVEDSAFYTCCEIPPHIEWVWCWPACARASLAQESSLPSSCESMVRE